MVMPAAAMTALTAVAVTLRRICGAVGVEWIDTVRLPPDGVAWTLPTVAGGGCTALAWRLQPGTRWTLAVNAATLSALMELAVLAAAYAALGALRPRWTTLLAAFVPAALAFVWLLLHEDVPGDELGVVDVAWYVGMSLAVGAVYVLVSAGGIVLGKVLRRLAS